MAETVHYFDWTVRDKPFTTDPKYAGKLTIGTHNQVLLDGRDVGHMKIKRMITGLRGWIEVCSLDEHGNEVWDEKKEGVVTQMLYGSVEYKQA